VGKRIADGLLSDKWLVVADDAFVCSKNIITPYSRNSLSLHQRTYNYFISLNRQPVERAFGLWKWKWGLFWRPLLIADNNIKRVIETTCRLHNFCIDVKRGGNLQDYIHHDDVFWQRVAAKMKRSSQSPSTLDFEPVYADADSVAAIVGVEHRPQRTIRQRILKHVMESGKSVPDCGLLLDPSRKRRACGPRPAAQAAVPVQQIGRLEQM